MAVYGSRWARLAIVLLAVGASASSLANGFAFDDRSIIADDAQVHHLDAPARFFTRTYWTPIQGGTLYRPLTSLAFAVEWKVGHGSPWVFHLANIILYVIVCLAVYRLGLLLIGPAGAWWAAALFAVHPVHVEAVGNAVGQSELWAALAVLLAVAYYVRVRRERELRPSGLVTLALLYGAGCLFKEHALVLPVLLLAAEVTLLKGESLRSSGRELSVVAVVLGAVAAGFWIVHARVTGHFSGEHANIVFRGMPYGTRLLTMLGVVPEWARLLLAPVHLSVDYSPQQVPIAAGIGWAQVAGAILLVGATGTAWYFRRRQPVVTFAIIWVGVALVPVSNLLIPTGILLAERTLFLPSVGVVLVLGVCASWLGQRAQRWSGAARYAALAIGGLVLAAGAARSAWRQPVWRNNQAYFAQMSLDAPRSYRAHWNLARRLAAVGRAAAADSEYAVARHLFPDDPTLLAEAANRFSARDRCAEALPLYRRSREIAPRIRFYGSGFVRCLADAGDLDEARQEALQGIVRRDVGAIQALARVDSLLRLRGTVVAKPQE